jgi:hypothetical protein
MKILQKNKIGTQTSFSTNFGAKVSFAQYQTLQEQI